MDVDYSTNHLRYLRVITNQQTGSEGLKEIDRRILLYIKAINQYSNNISFLFDGDAYLACGKCTGWCAQVTDGTCCGKHPFVVVMRTSGDLRLTVVEFLFRQEAEYGGRTFSLFLQIGILLRASIYGEKKFKFLLDLLDPKNQQKSIQYLQSGKKTTTT